LLDSSDKTLWYSERNKTDPLIDSSLLLQHLRTEEVPEEELDVVMDMEGEETGQQVHEEHMA
jgi:hypothetical protein